MLGTLTHGSAHSSGGMNGVWISPDPLTPTNREIPPMLKMTERFQALGQVPAQTKFTAAIAVAALLIAAVALGVALGARRGN